MATKILDVPFQSQNNNPFNDKYAGSDADPSPDGCWMNAKDGSGKEGYGPGSVGCKSNTEGPDANNKCCVRPGSCNTTSLFMAMKFLGIGQKPDGGPKGESLNDWLNNNPF